MYTVHLQCVHTVQYTATMQCPRVVNQLGMLLPPAINVKLRLMQSFNRFCIEYEAEQSSHMCCLTLISKIYIENAIDNAKRVWKQPDAAGEPVGEGEEAEAGRLQQAQLRTCARDIRLLEQGGSRT